MPKPFLTYEQQLVKLRDEKCIVIENESMTLSKLQQVGYYSLVSGYKHLFRIPAQKTYKGGTTFREIVALYEFDESLRELFLHYLLHIERHIRSLLSYYFTEKYGEYTKSLFSKMFETSGLASRSFTFCVIAVGSPPHLRNLFQISIL